MNDLHFSPAVAPDCAIQNDRVHVVYGHQPWTWLELDLDGNLLSRRTQPTGYFPKTNGAVSVAHEGGVYLQWLRDGACFQYSGDHPYGNNPIIVSPSGLIAHQRYPDVIVGNGTYMNIARPTGLWEMRDDGSFDTWDVCYARPKLPGGVGLSYRTPDRRMEVCEGESGVVGIFDGAPFHLWPGLDTKWPRCDHDGEHVVIVAWGDPGPQARVWIGTIAELKAQTMPEITINHLDTLRAERAKYGTPLGFENAWKVINATAYTHRDEGWKLLYKPTGTNWVVDGVGYSIDVLVNPTTKQAVDCLVSSETDGVPAWQELAWYDDMATRARDPIAPEEAPPPEPEPEQEPAPTVEQRVAILEVYVARIMDWIGSY